MKSGTKEVSIGKDKGNNSLWRSSHRWKYSINIDLKSMYVVWIIQVQDKDQRRVLMNMVLDFQFCKILEFIDYICD
jgi:hypothetical protein